MKHFPSFCPMHHAKPYPDCERPESCEKCIQEHVDLEVH